MNHNYTSRTYMILKLHVRVTHASMLTKMVNIFPPLFRISYSIHVSIKAIYFCNSSQHSIQFFTVNDKVLTIVRKVYSIKICVVVVQSNMYIKLRLSQL